MNFLGRKGDTCATLVVRKVKVRTETQHSIPPVKQTGYRCVDWVMWIQARDQWRVFEKAVTNFLTS